MRVKLIMMSVALAVSMGVAAVSVEQTAAAKGNCSVKAVGSKNSANASGSKFTRKNGKVTAKFRVTGKNCSQAVSLVAWKLPSGKVKPYNKQKLDSFSRGVFKPGVHTLTVDLPNCAYQVDLVKGKQVTGKNGGPRYYERNLGWVVKTGKKCHQHKQVIVKHETEVETEVVEKEVVHKVIVEKEVPAELPQTGPVAALSGLVGLPTLAASATYYIRSRRFNG